MNQPLLSKSNVDYGSIHDDEFVQPTVQNQPPRIRFKLLKQPYDYIMVHSDMSYMTKNDVLKSISSYIDEVEAAQTASSASATSDSILSYSFDGNSISMILPVHVYEKYFKSPKYYFLNKSPIYMAVQLDIDRELSPPTSLLLDIFKKDQINTMHISTYFHEYILFPKSKYADFKKMIKKYPE